MVVRLLLCLLLLTGCSGLSAPEPEGPLTGDRLVEALQEGGLVVYLRHTETDDAPDGMATDDCSQQRNLTAAGRQDARAIGAALRALEVPVGRVIASPYCRTTETAELAFGHAQPEDALLPVATGADGEERGRKALNALLADEPEDGISFLVGHISNLRLAADVTPEEGGAVVFRPDGDGGFRLVAEVPPRGFTRLARQRATGP